MKYTGKVRDLVEHLLHKTKTTPFYVKNSIKFIRKKGFPEKLEKPYVSGYCSDWYGSRIEATLIGYVDKKGNEFVFPHAADVQYGNGAVDECDAEEPALDYKEDKVRALIIVKADVDEIENGYPPIVDVEIYRP